MKKYNLARTLLMVYNHLERVADSIDGMIEANALGSFYVSSSTFQKFGTMAVSDKIIGLSARKVTLINLKILIEDALVGCKKQNADLLMQKYFEKNTAQAIAESMNLAMRTYFRKLNSAISDFSSNLERQGLTESAALEMLKGEGWIMRVYHQNEKGEEVELGL